MTPEILSKQLGIGQTAGKNAKINQLGIHDTIVGLDAYDLTQNKIIQRRLQDHFEKYGPKQEKAKDVEAFMDQLKQIETQITPKERVEDGTATQGLESRGTGASDALSVRQQAGTAEGAGKPLGATMAFGTTDTGTALGGKAASDTTLEQEGTKPARLSEIYTELADLYDIRDKEPGINKSIVNKRIKPLEKEARAIEEAKTVTQEVYTENKPVTTKEKEQAQVDALADLQLESAEDTFNALSTTLSYNELSSNLKKEVRNYKKQNQLTQDVADQIAQMHRNEAAAKVAKRINKPEASLFAEESKAERKAKEVRMEEEGAFESTILPTDIELSAFQKQFSEDKTVGQALKRLLKQKKSKNFPGLNIPQKILINALLKIPGISEMNFGVFKHPDSRRGNKLQRYEEIKGIVGERQVPKTTPIKDANGRVIGESDVFYETEPIFGGEYDEKTNIVKLYQSSSVNTLLHEVVHAATVKVLKNNIINGVGVTPLGKKIMRIYNAAQEAADSKSKRYGLENVYEFIAEAFTNPEFQTFLANQASITGAKPSLRSKLTSLFNDLFSAIKDMLGIPKAAQSLLGDVFDLSSPLFKGPNVELTTAAKIAADLAMEPTSHYSMSMPASDTAASIDLMNSPNLIYSKLPTFNDGIVDRGKDVISKLPSLARRVFLGFTSLGDLNELYGKILPSIKALDTALKLRNNTHRQLKENIDHVANKALQALKGKSPALVKKFNFVAHELSRLNIDPRPGKGNDNHPMVQAWRALPPELQKAGIDIVESYEGFVDKMIKFLQSESSTRAQEIRDKFESKKLPFYFPFLRQGNYWIQFTDNNNETVSLAYDNPRQQKMMNDYLTSVKAKDLRMFNRVDQITRKSAPPVGFMSDIIKIMEQGGASPEVIDKAYQTYITLFPAESIRQQFRQREGNLGFIGDVVQGYATTAPKMATQLANLQHGKAIDEAYSDVENEARNDSSEIAANVMQELSKRRDFFSNPVASSWVYGASNVNFFWSIAGNVSSALVNLTILPTVVLPQLAINPITGKYEYGKAYAALNEARSLFFKGGKDKSREFLSIRTFGENENLSPDLKRLHERAIEMGAIQYSVGRDLADIRKAPSDQYSDFSHKMQTSLGLIFEGTERFNREVTLVAAYKLARSNGMNENEAIDHALRFTSKIHTEAVPEAGARYLQAGFPKVALIFKRFAMAQIFNIYTLFNAAKNGMNPMEKKVARRQLIGIYGMNFALAGLQGVPLYGAVQVLANMLLADDDEPYDLDQEVRESFGMLGYKGPANLLFGIDIASRTGFNGMVWRDDPKRLAEVGYTSYFIEHFLGPTFSTGKMVLQDGPAMMANGQYERGLEKMLPSFLKNPLKAMRYATEGAKNPNGASLVDDVSGYNQFMQIFGFTPQNVSEAYAKAGSMKQADKKLMDRRDGLLDALYLARTNGDVDQMSRIQEKINRYNELNPLPPYVLRPSSVSRSMKARDKALDESVYGVHFSPKALQQLEEKYGN
jgi:dihydroneopterin aldolase